MKKTIMTLLLAVVLIYLACLGYLYFNQRNMVFKPDTARPDPAGYGNPEFTTAEVQSADGLTLKSWYFPPAKAGSPVIVFFQGNGGNFASRYPHLIPYLNEGYGLLFAGYRGYGGNPGKPSEEGIYADSRAYIDYLTARNIPLSDIILYGESLGTGVAVQMATEYPVRAVVLQSPFSNLYDIAADRYPVFPVKLLMKDRFESERKIGSLTMPVLILHASDDTLIPIRFAQKLHEAAPENAEFKIYDKGGHGDLYHEHPELKILDFLGKITTEKETP